MIRNVFVFIQELLDSSCVPLELYEISVEVIKSNDIKILLGYMFVSVHRHP